MMRLGLPSARRPLRRRFRAATAVAGFALLALVVAGCSSSNEYPIDFFSEMHYQKSYRSQESPRLDSPPSAVPFRDGHQFVGGAVGVAKPLGPSSDGTPVPLAMPPFSMEQARDLQNPLPQNEQTVQLGQQLFTVNCVVCHGANLDGQGIAAGLVFQANQVPVPANLKDPRIVQLTDGELFHVLTYGFGDYMPPFGELLTPEQRWAIVSYIRSQQGQ